MERFCGILNQFNILGTKKLFLEKYVTFSDFAYVTALKSYGVDGSFENYTRKTETVGFK